MGLALGIGLIVGSQAARNGTIWWSIPLILCLMLLILLLPHRARRFLMVSIVGLTIAAVAGVLRNDPDPIPSGSFGQTILQATVTSDPKVRGDGVTAYLRWKFPDQDTSAISFAFMPAAPRVGRHDRLLLSASYDQSGFVSVSSMRIEQTAGQAEIVRRNIRNKISRTVHRSVPGSPGTLALGLLIGDDSGLTDQERDAVRESGLSHITAVSGWNVTLVAVTTAAFFAAFRLRSWTLLGAQVAIIAIYVWIVGLDPPVVRAAIMATVALVAIQTGSPVHILSLLVLAASVMVLAEPETLSSLSFQLSFLSMLGLIGALAVTLRYRRLVAMLIAPAVATIAAAVATAPLLVLTFGSVSLGTLPANMIVTPLVPFATYGAAIVALTGSFSGVSSFVGIPVWILCSGILWVAEFVASIPGLYLEFEPPGSAVIAAIYIVLAGIVFPLLPEGRYLLRSTGGWATQYPAHACVTGLSTAFVLVVVFLAG